MKRLFLLFRRVFYFLRFFGQNRIDVHSSSWIGWRASIKIFGQGEIRIGKHCEIHNYVMLISHGGKIFLGDYVSVNPFTIIYGIGDVYIGNYTRIAASSTIIPANHKQSDGITPLTKSGISKQGIYVDENVWIGSGCRILDGVKIGRCAIVGAGSVVTKDIPAFKIFAGVPAKEIC